MPQPEDRELVHQIIYNELVHGIIKSDSKQKFQTIIRKLQNEGAEGVILGCTEIPMLISAGDLDLPVFDTTKIHAEKAAKWATKF